MIAKLLPLLAIFVDHADIVVDIRSGLAIIDVCWIVRSKRQVRPLKKKLGNGSE